MKDQILALLTKETEDCKQLGPNPNLTTEEICKRLPIKRNTVSQYLNELVAERKCIKIKTRPAYFYSTDAMKRHFFMPLKDMYNSFEELLNDNPEEKGGKSFFSNIIGHDLSLKGVIDQIKTSVFYPGSGLPMIFIGETGVGKSMFARLTYKYCIERKLLDQSAPFIELNCSQYFHNPELLTSNLFGYVKGAFTGADHDKVGMLEAADGGVLFLDECHRLDAESQEKFFTFMDKGYFQRMGESKTRHKSRVRIIFATTESLQANFLRTFLRRIPMTVEIPPLSQRSLKEVQYFIYHFFIEEAKKMNRPLHISTWVINRLSNLQYSDNVGELENNVRLICANALSKNPDNELISINGQDIPESLYQQFLTVRDLEKENTQKTVITPTSHVSDFLKADFPQKNILNELMKILINLFQKYAEGEVKEEFFLHQSSMEVGTTMEMLIHRDGVNRQETILKYISGVIQEIAKFLEHNYLIKLNGNTLIVLTHYIYSRNDFTIQIDECYEKIRDELIDFLKRKLVNESKLLKSISDLLEARMDFLLDANDWIILLYFLTNLDITHSRQRMHSVVLAHGFSTASSIADVVNRFLNEKIFDSFDMPFNVPLEKVEEYMDYYIKELDCSNGLVVLVDMGSLMIIFDKLKDKINGPLLVANNVSTQSVLLTGEMIKKNRPIEEIDSRLKNDIPIQHKLGFPKKNKEPMIITSCSSGVGAARKLREFLLGSLPSEISYRIEAVDLHTLSTYKTNFPLLKQYQITGIIGTSDPKIDGIPYIALEELVSSRGMERIKALFPTVSDPRLLKIINDNFVRNLSVERLLPAITILDVKKMIGYVDEMINSLERNGNFQMSNSRKSILYIHTSSLVERLIRHIPQPEALPFKKKGKKYEEQIKLIQTALLPLENAYNVTVGERELDYLQNIIFDQ
ncbi:sigma 54-interacting transcriptional regulator [Sporolactobacillus shoreicorticis]|uniref:Sigma 54-interacting transcriptional regulator n=1 Tax=Sporolactobacillus shoreicorticis TaxID=1923877 RepID=A0ABW5S1F4_9BACL|nr:sigma 54-interacting transcriptional regulator [Sporolactobacillus shoreicorticis]MCO7124659.1 sigma 54-interacting transcriptional regulator [Sporolactobacillus shoreicorticis]